MRIFNTFSAKIENFIPFDKNCVRVYVCGPTVYDRIHLGNARTLVVFDLIIKALRRKYKKVVYVRNITDIDDKIIARAQEEKTSTVELATKMIAQFHSDANALGCDEPDFEPRATDHVAEMITIIKSLVEKKHAYISEDGHVLFAIKSFPQYGCLSKRKHDNNNDCNQSNSRSNSRVEALECKRDADDFVLWKPAENTNTSDSDNTATPAWDSPWGRGRPGWHIECSAMSRLLLGGSIDIHGGGQDLIFPHHENEIAQSRAAEPSQPFVKYWVHNGYLLAERKKMSKSLGNFQCVADALNSVSGEAIRLALLRAHYRHPLDFSQQRLLEAEKNLDKLYAIVASEKNENSDIRNVKIMQQVEEALANDLNTPLALAAIFSFADNIANLPQQAQKSAKQELKSAANLLGLLQNQKRIGKNLTKKSPEPDANIDDKWVQKKINERERARASRDFVLADKIRDELAGLGVLIEDTRVEK